MGTYLRVLGESYPMDIIPNLQALNGFGKILCVLVLWMKVASHWKG